MASTFAWLDYSSAEQDKTRKVLDLFTETDTRDELGIGSVRDGFADLLFPGSSTIQTRARYFLFIPWLYQRLEHPTTSATEFARRARRDEIALIDTLLKSSDTQGIIGSRAKASLQRLPSSIYWHGLGVWGIRRFPGAQDAYHRLHAAPIRASQQARRTDDGDLDGGPLVYTWHPGLPSAPADFPDVASFALRPAEAAFLREQLLAHIPRTLLTWLVDHSRALSAVPFPWNHPQYAEFPHHLQEQLEHARIFSEVMHGAALLYNLLLARQGNQDELAERYHDRMQLWADHLDQQALATWDPARTWTILRAEGARIPEQTCTFVQQWAGLVRDPVQFRTITTSDTARRLIHTRERATKRGQARLDNQRALELWNGASGTAQLDYRWATVQQLVNDIIAGAETGGHDAESTG